MTKTQRFGVITGMVIVFAGVLLLPGCGGKKVRVPDRYFECVDIEQELAEVKKAYEEVTESWNSVTGLLLNSQAEAENLRRKVEELSKRLGYERSKVLKINETTK